MWNSMTLVCIIFNLESRLLNRSFSQPTCWLGNNSELVIFTLKLFHIMPSRAHQRIKIECLIAIVNFLEVPILYLVVI